MAGSEQMSRNVVDLTNDSDSESDYEPASFQQEQAAYRDSFKSPITSPLNIAELVKPHKDEGDLMEELGESKDRYENEKYNVLRCTRRMKKVEQGYNRIMQATYRNQATEKRLKAVATGVRKRGETDRQRAQESKDQAERKMEVAVKNNMHRIRPLVQSWETENDLQIQATEQLLLGLKEKKADFKATRERIKGFLEYADGCDGSDVVEHLESVRPIRTWVDPESSGLYYRFANQTGEPSSSNGANANQQVG